MLQLLYYYHVFFGIVVKLSRGVQPTWFVQSDAQNSLAVNFYPKKRRNRFLVRRILEWTTQIKCKTCLFLSRKTTHGFFHFAQVRHTPNRFLENESQPIIECFVHFLILILQMDIHTCSVTLGRYTRLTATHSSLWYGAWNRSMTWFKEATP